MEIKKRDGTIVSFKQEKITLAIFKAAQACGGNDFEKAVDISNEVTNRLTDADASVEHIQNLIEKVLMERGHTQTARAFILYREKHKQAREKNALIGATINMFNDYLDDQDWRIQENANTQKSVAGLNNYVRERFTKDFWLNEIYPDAIRKAHECGDFHIHDLGLYSTYCGGWSLQQLLQEGWGVAGKEKSKPAKHLRAFLGQIVNSTMVTQGEAAGAQAWCNFDTYCAPFIHYDNLTYTQVKQSLQEFVFNLNIPSRTGGQACFSNVTADIICPKALRNTPVILGGKPQEKTYGEFQSEMDMFNRAFCDVMLEGDAKGAAHTFPVVTVNITKDFNWGSDAATGYFELACKYGSPYLCNYINSDMSPDDAVSMCCRLKINISDLKKRGNGLFGSNPLTGSIGVVTLNLPRAAKCSSKEHFFSRLKELCILAKDSLEIKRKIIEEQTKNGLYPYSAKFLQGVYDRSGEYWSNHFNTIGIVGMHEACLNLFGDGIEKHKEFVVETLNFLREVLRGFQEETGHQYNLEATPAEGICYRLAKLDGDFTYYTNSTQLPVGYTDNVFEMLDYQEGIQSLYTGGTVQHLYLGERIEDVEACKELVKTIFTKYTIPYISITPTFSVCEKDGYLVGNVERCPKCGAETEVWSRVTGYLRPVKNYNPGKKQEFKERKTYVLRGGDTNG